MRGSRDRMLADHEWQVRHEFLHALAPLFPFALAASRLCGFASSDWPCWDQEVKSRQAAKPRRGKTWVLSARWGWRSTGTLVTRLTPWALILPSYGFT